jgi:hypothetical protein
MKNRRLTNATLPRDYTRCHDDSCEQRHECLRWLDKSGNSIVSNAATLKTSDYYCPHFLSCDTYD